MKQGKRWGMLILCAVVLLFAGVIYAWSVLSGPLEFTGPQLSFCFTLTLCFFCLGGLLSGLVSGKLSIRCRMLIAAALSLGGFSMAALQHNSLALLYVGYGVLAGLGIGIVYNTVISVGNSWFPDRKGLSSGVMMMTFGFSALLLGKAANALFSVPAFGWRKTYLLLGGLLTLALVVGAFLLKKPDTGTRLPTSASSGAEVSTGEMVRRSDFWKLFIFFTLFAAVGSAAIGFGKKYFVSVGVTAENAVTWAGLLSVFNGLGRILSGWLFDRTGMKATRFISSFVVIAATAVSLAAAAFGLPALGIVGLCLCAVSYGFSPTVSAALVADFYGMKHFSLNFPVLNLVLIPASFMSTLAGNLVEKSGGVYVSTFAVLLGASVIGLIVNFTIRKAKEEGKDKR